MLSRMDVSKALNKPKSLKCVFPVKKLRGETSMETIYRVRDTLVSLYSADCNKISKFSLRNELKMGHGGTLDPNATGVMVIGINDGCGLLSTYLKGTKEYEGTVLLGKETDSLDVLGNITKEETVEEFPISAVNDSLTSFLGESYQIPPIYSAIKVNGKKLYELARKKKEIPALEPRRIFISKIQLISYSHPRIKVRVECTGGTYIRSLARDLCQKLGTVGLLEDLCRTRHCQYELSECVDLENENLIENLLGRWRIRHQVQ